MRVVVPCLLFLSALGVAQSPIPEVTKALVCDGPSTCGISYVSGHMYESIVSDGKIVVLVSLVIDGKYVRADIFVTNGSKGNVDVLPSNFVLTEVTPKQKVLKFVDGDKLMRSAERKLAWGNALTAMSGSMARQQTTTTTTSNGTVNVIGSAPITGTYSGTSMTTASVPDYAAQSQAAQTIEMRNEAFANIASFTQRTILRANTVSAGQNVRGYMFFERDKKEKLVMLSGIVGDTIYQFPFLLTMP